MAEDIATQNRVVERRVSIKTVDGAIIQGKINIGPNKRISDVFLTGEAPFIVVYNVGRQHVQDKVLIINKQHIVWVEPEE